MSCICGPVAPRGNWSHWYAEHPTQVQIPAVSLGIWVPNLLNTRVSVNWNFFKSPLYTTVVKMPRLICVYSLDILTENLLL